MNRRGFLGLIASAAFSTMGLARAVVQPFRHQLVGNGKHDDTAALQALLNGEPVLMPDGHVQQVRHGQAAYLPRGTFFIGGSIELPAVPIHGRR